MVAERFPPHFTAGRKPDPQSPTEESNADGLFTKMPHTRRESEVAIYIVHATLSPLVNTVVKMSFYARLIVAALPAIPESEERGLQKKGSGIVLHQPRPMSNSCNGNHIPQKPTSCQKKVLKNLLPLKKKKNQILI